MPCHDPRDNEERAETRERLNKATRIACEAISILESKSLQDDLSFEALEWWDEHQEMDKERKIREAKRERAKEVKAKVDAYREQLEREIEEEFEGFY